MIDNLDKLIISTLQDNARVSYAEMAKSFGVSPATIHVRVEKLRQAGIITGTHIRVDARKLGYDVCCFIGINLARAGDYPNALAKLQALPEVIEAHYTTGKYSIFVKVMVPSIDDLQQLLIHKIQSIAEVQATETLISLQQPIQRPVPVQ
ncbi:Lrp/AsnC family transcriptional regulator, regulator for asnA, asnC and gidA [Pseudidiomarina indica]|uniref:Lrp/AsnC family transcriptional regulator, regulator for asnA, asnC and gidA n=1 Tax=Pseudidiomarina indica TaxID=1159017 RepID=A0A1G6CWU9_9GAMM|nr:transcriptional regulator AsnC [Pseudidiomarina indica]SDB37321.1 Lrp/AsnC family transcriptional regulator, regulator for asnA, asnC and gidA [Pseudidiomarina indica]